jgi:hypothetical protein
MSSLQCGVRKRQNPRRVKRRWEIIADNLKKAGWSWDCVASVGRDGRTIFVADAGGGHWPGETKRFAAVNTHGKIRL